jgi:hypothetical protein
MESHGQKKLSLKKVNLLQLIKKKKILTLKESQPNPEEVSPKMLPRKSENIKNQEVLCIPTSCTILA